MDEPFIERTRWKANNMMNEIKHLKNLFCFNIVQYFILRNKIMIAWPPHAINVQMLQHNLYKNCGILSTIHFIDMLTINSLKDVAKYVGRDQDLGFT